MCPLLLTEAGSRWVAHTQLISRHAELSTSAYMFASDINPYLEEIFVGRRSLPMPCAVHMPDAIDQWQLSQLSNPRAKLNAGFQGLWTTATQTCSDTMPEGPSNPEEGPSVRPLKTLKTCDRHHAQDLLQLAASHSLPELPQLSLTPMAQAAFRQSPFAQQPQHLAEVQDRGCNPLYTSLHNAFAGSSTGLRTISLLKCLEPVVVVVGLSEPGCASGAMYLMERICQCKLLQGHPKTPCTICVNMVRLPRDIIATFRVRVDILEEEVSSKERIAETATRMLLAISQGSDFLDPIEVHIDICSPEISTRQIVGLWNPLTQPVSTRSTGALVNIVARFVRNQPAALIAVLPSDASDGDALRFMAESRALANICQVDSMDNSYLLAFVMETPVPLDYMQQHFTLLDVGQPRDRLENVSLLHHLAGTGMQMSGIANAADLSAAKDCEAAFIRTMLHLQEEAMSEPAQNALKKHMGLDSLMLQVQINAPQMHTQCSSVPLMPELHILHDQYQVEVLEGR